MQVQNQKNAFSLIEVIISIGVIVMLTIMVVTMMRSNIDMNQIIRQESIVTNRLSKAMNQLSKDIENAYLISKKDVVRSTSNRASGTYFYIERNLSAIKMTTTSNKRFRRGEKSSDLIYVVYELKKNDDDSGRTSLYRGVKKVIPEDFKEDPPMKLFIRDIKEFQVKAWNGERFNKDKWDSENGDTKNILPRMVEIRLETWLNSSESSGDDLDEKKKGEILMTRVFLNRAIEFVELKKPLGTMRFNE